MNCRELMEADGPTLAVVVAVVVEGVSRMMMHGLGCIY